MAMVFLRITTGGTAPTANSTVKLYLIRRSNDGTLDLADDAVGTTDAAVTVEPIRAELLGVIQVTATTNATYTKSFLAYDLSADYSFVVWNATGQTLNATAGNFALQVVPITMEAQ